ncbi:MAG: membrane protein insertase YidC [Myxococcota bacterium]|jgi:YidC/Oxa1 family membrane protein insertase|nr:membrane protein insertase YidC [Myxococcota bacterium]
MDWKILLLVVSLLGVFYFAQTCGQEEPRFDDIQAQEQAKRRTEQSIAEAKSKAAQSEKALAQARLERGELPTEGTARLETADFAAVITTRGAALRSFELKNSQYRQAPRDWSTGLRAEVDDDKLVPIDLVSTNVGEYSLNAPLRFEVFDGLPGLLPDSEWEIIEAGPRVVRLRYTQPGLPVTFYKKFELPKKGTPYELWVTVRVENHDTSKLVLKTGFVQQGYQHEDETGGSILSSPPDLLNGICRADGSTLRKSWKDLDNPANAVGKMAFAGIETNFFVSAMIPTGELASSCLLDVNKGMDPKTGKIFGVLRAELRFAEVSIEPGGSQIVRLCNYLGPKRFGVLQQAGHELVQAVDFGFFWPIARVMLAMLLEFHKLVGNWGLAIIILTFLVKVVLIPLTHRSFKSAERMRALKPEIDKLNEKHKDDATAKQQAIMALYKQHGVNPLGGCLPSLLQMPIWIALYSTLRTAPELYRAPFFGWIQDLSVADPYFVTPLIMGVMMFFQQRMTPMAGDPLQAKMMLWLMPIMFTGMMLFLPSGLTLYILVNTTLSIIHQMIIHRKRPDVVAARAAASASQSRKG